MEMREMLKFVKMDESFFTVLSEYKKTGNTKIVKEKIFENLFTNYDAIKILSNDFKDKISMDFFVGEKNEEIFKNMKERLEKHSELYELKKFIEGVVFDSAYPNGKIYTVEGSCEGIILDELKGDHGFRYDPIIFVPIINKTFAEIPLEIKNKISHRSKALFKMHKLLKQLQTTII